MRKMTWQHISESYNNHKRILKTVIYQQVWQPRRNVQVSGDIWSYHYHGNKIIHKHY